MVILLVAIVLLFVVGAMAVLAIDLVTIYTARSEAQLAADGAALAGARVMANSGATSADPTNLALETSAQNLATAMAKQVAVRNRVGGRLLNPAEVDVTFPPSIGDVLNPRVTVRVSRTDLPTFFARIWGQTQTTVAASATAEAYNPSGINAIVAGTGPPIAPACVKPWLLPNLDPLNPGNPIFDVAFGTIQDRALLGSPLASFQFACSTDDCSSLSTSTPTEWKFYPAAQASLPAPTQSLPACGALYNAYQLSIAGCVQTPIACGGVTVVPSSMVAIDQAPYTPNGTNRMADTVTAINCLAHSTTGNGDRVDPAASPLFQFVAGADNPVAGAVGSDVMVTDSLVTVPVFDSSLPWPPTSTPPTVQVIGFVQLFLNPDGTAPPAGGPISTTVINIAGCGNTATGQPVLGNGASTIPVRLIAQ